MSRPIRGFGALPSFAAAARRKSFTVAANDLGVTQAAISHQIRELEDQLEVKLFHRNSRAVTLTAAGEILAKAVDEAFDGLSRAVAQMKSTKPRPRARCRCVLRHPEQPDPALAAGAACCDLVRRGEPAELSGRPAAGRICL